MKYRDEREVGGWGKVIVVVGMQYGSEGKGVVTSYLAPCASMGVRSGAANAGHTIYYNGQKFIMRQIPSVWINPLAKLVIGAGAIINLDILFSEIELLRKFTDIDNRLYIDRRAHIVMPGQILAEQGTDLAQRIGSTSAIAGEGIGMAMADKVLRKSSCVQAKDLLLLKYYVADTVDMINDYLDHDQIVILEGTQGFGLSLDHGSFPYVTSRDTSATAIAASVGIGTHQFEVEVVGVTRTYPIRVAGNSGPFGKDSQEISWSDITRKSKSKKVIEERTTVTGNVRRVATFSWEDFLNSCKVNRLSEIAITFADYLDASLYNQEKISDKVLRFIGKIEERSGVPVKLVKTGPNAIIDFDHYRKSMLRKMSA